MVMDKTVELRFLSQNKKQKNTSQLTDKGVGNSKERERLVAKKMEYRTFIEI